MVTELVTLGVVGLILVVAIFLLRRAGEKSADRPKDAKDRVAELAEPEAQEPTRDRVRKRDRVKPATKHKKERKAARKPEPEEEEEEDQEEEAPAAPTGPTDQEAKAAYKAGLAKTRGGFVAKLGKLFGKKKIDADVLGGLEDVLFTADIGPRAADRIFASVKSNLSKDDLTDPHKIWSQIRTTSATILTVDAPPIDFAKKKPFVLLILGVNGVGKTTTIGKLAQRLRREERKVLLAAGDTFRAAATEQLEVWGGRADSPVVKGKSGSDPSSVIFEAVKRGVAEDYDVVICDTAGRLHTKTELMDELKKVRKVMDKAMPGCPHETWLVLDATTGQNAIQQAKTFKDAMEITGLVLTKLDGSAKGGVILGICDELKVPVRYVGVGEKIDDLRPFDPQAFVEALYDDAEISESAA